MRRLAWGLAGWMVAWGGNARADAPMSVVVERGRAEITSQVSYDPSYVGLAYPGGDVAPQRGVCTDVVIRAYRSIGVDFQRLVHEDVSRRLSAYRGFVKVPDKNIDHRRVGPLLVYLRAHATSLPKEATSDTADTFAAGDIVVWSFGKSGTPDHVGLVSDRQGPRGLPLVVHNMGPVPSEDDRLDAWPLLGHFRLTH